MTAGDFVAPALFVVAVPLVSLAHELGHAAAALALSKGPVVVQVGSAKYAVRARFGRLTISFSPVGAGGVCRAPTSGLSRRRALARVLAGPGVNLLLCVALLGTIAVHGGDTASILGPIAGFAALQGISNVLPRRARYGIGRGQPSDGLRAKALITDQPIPPSDSRASSKQSSSPIQVGALVTTREQVLRLAGGIALGLGLLTHLVSIAALLPWMFGLTVLASLMRDPRTGSAAPGPADPTPSAPQS